MERSFVDHMFGGLIFPKRAYLLVAASILGLGSCLSCADKAPLVLQHDKSGNLFYVCRNGQASVVACDPGFHYNRDTKSCINMEDMSRVPYCPIDQEVTLYLPHEEACNKFYTCFQGTVEENTCPAGLDFNPEINVCDWPKPGGCGITTPSYNTTTENPGTNTTITQSTPDSNSTITEGPSNSTTTESPSNSTTSSPPTNSTTEGPSNSTTTESPSNSTTSSPPTNSTTEGPSNSTTVERRLCRKTFAGLQSCINVEDMSRVPYCPIDQENILYLPHEEACNKFYTCLHGTLEENTCPAGLDFNPEINVCDWPKPGGCGITTPSYNTTTENPDTNTTITQSTPDSNSTITEGPSNSTTTESPSNSTTSSPPTNSTTEGPSNSTTTESPSNSTTSSPPTNSTTEGPSNSTTTESPSNSTTSSPPTNSTTEGPSNSTTVEGRLCRKTFAGLQSCINVEDMSRVPYCPIDQEDILYLPHEEACNKFYTCFQGTLEENTCPAGLDFNPEINVCDWPKPGGCGITTPSYNTTTENPDTNTTITQSTPDSNSTITEGPSNSTTTESPSNSTTSSPPTNSTTEGPSNSTTTEGPSNSTTSSPPINSTSLGYFRVPNCPANQTETIYFAHELYCNKFYYCYLGTLIESTCPAGLEFNPEENVCDWPKPGGCGITTPSSNTTTTEAPSTNTTIAQTTPDSNSTITEGPSNSTTTESPSNSTTTENPSNSTTTSPPTNSTTEGPSNSTTTESPSNSTTTESPSNSTTTESPSNSTTSSPPTNSTTENPSNSTTTEGPSNSTTSSPPTNSTTEGPSNSTTEGPTTSKPSVCVLNETTISIIPHESNCQHFYVCFAGIASEYECDDNKEFDPVLANCVDISEDGCTASQTTTVTAGPTEEVTDEPQHESCKPDDNNVTIIAHETDCHKFYVCFMGVATEFSCDLEQNMEFDPIQKICVPITGNGCTVVNQTTSANFSRYFKLF